MTARWSALLRSFGVQAAWGYKRLAGLGFALVAEPLLRELRLEKGDDAYRQALARHSNFFNAHPYMVSLAAAAVAKADLSGTDPETIERFKASLTGLLGALGDKLFWTGVLPACSALALLGAALGPVWVVGALLIPYNVVHIATRYVTLVAGSRGGLRVVGEIRRPVVQALRVWIPRGAAVLLGAAMPLVALGLMDRFPASDAMWVLPVTATMFFTGMLWKPQVGTLGVGATVIVVTSVLGGILL